MDIRAHGHRSAGQKSAERVLLQQNKWRKVAHACGSAVGNEVFTVAHIQVSGWAGVLAASAAHGLRTRWARA